MTYRQAPALLSLLALAAVVTPPAVAATAKKEPAALTIIKPEPGEKSKAAAKKSKSARPAAAEPAKTAVAAPPKSAPAAKGKPARAAAKPDKSRTGKAAPAAAGHVLGTLKSTRPAAGRNAAPAAAVPWVAPRRNGVQLALAASTATAAIDVNALKRALEFVRSRKPSDAMEVRNSIADPVAQKVIEWAVLRSDDAGVDFKRFASFIAQNPGWPSMVTFRRRAEAALYQDGADPNTVRSFFAQSKPLSAKGKLALARALAAAGDRRGTEALVRETWRTDSLSDEVEARTLDEFGALLTRDDIKARMDRRLYSADDAGSALKLANKLGGHEPAIAKARIAVVNKAGNAKALLDAVPAAARNDAGYIFSRAQWLRRGNHDAEAAALILSVRGAIDPHHDLDEWWVERRVLARELLDAGDAKTAYAVVRDATLPARDNYRAEQQFTAGWIALRFLKDPATAYSHFERIAEGQENPIALARAAYWQGRAAEAMGRTQQARSHYNDAAQYPTAYYGQIARSKLGVGEIGLNGPPALPPEQRAHASRLEVVRAVELLYMVDAKDLVATAMADLGDKCDDVGALLALVDLAAKYKDARGMLLVGKLALGRGMPTEHAAFPTIGLPDYTPIGPAVEPAIVYSIARQESWFNPRTVSSAKAMGLMQVTPAAGKHLASKYKVPFDVKRLLTDNVYNVQMGAAELGENIQDYRGSYILAFAGYNAGRTRVKDWIARYGDPRDPKVDPIDWVERIPFSETRNYVQRVMENVQVYRARFGGNNGLLIEADLRRGAATN